MRIVQTIPERRGDQQFTESRVLMDDSEEL